MSNARNLARLLPDSSGKVPKASLPSGSQLQVVNYQTNTEIQTSSSAYTDTGQSVSITPIFASSKVLVEWNIAGLFKNSSNTYMRIQLLRGSTVLCQIEGAAAYDNSTGENNIGASSISYLDSPNTTSAVTYKIQYKSETGTNYVGINRNQATSSATLTEVAG